MYMQQVYSYQLILLIDEYTLRLLQRLKLMHFMNMYISGFHMFLKTRNTMYMTKSYYITFSFLIFSDLGLCF